MPYVPTEAQAEYQRRRERLHERLDGYLEILAIEQRAALEDTDAALARMKEFTLALLEFVTEVALVNCTCEDKQLFHAQSELFKTLTRLAMERERKPI